uniref:Putative secreted protein n=1 Tax=Anopheles marajoara TaxID=58244 RepID=A0A2M4C8V6_9DIPT
MHKHVTVLNFFFPKLRGFRVLWLLVLTFANGDLKTPFPGALFLFFDWQRQTLKNVIKINTTPTYAQPHERNDTHDRKAQTASSTQATVPASRQYVKVVCRK